MSKIFHVSRTKMNVYALFPMKGKNQVFVRASKFAPDEFRRYMAKNEPACNDDACILSNLGTFEGHENICAKRNDVLKTLATVGIRDTSQHFSIYDKMNVVCTNRNWFKRSSKKC